MNRIVVVLALGVGGCKSLESVTVVGSAYVETDRPEGKAVAKIEIRYTPPGNTSRTAEGTAAKDRQTTKDAAPPQPPAQPAKKRAPANENKSDPVKTNRETPTRPTQAPRKSAGNALLEWLWPAPAATLAPPL
ncbi:MAG TPA: hypothetical protein VEL76_24720 [Gemmataceae bacterium]|nr:hypothetical protein [Gemmataceae bacterium]